MTLSSRAGEILVIVAACLGMVTAAHAVDQPISAAKLVLKKMSIRDLITTQGAMPPSSFFYSCEEWGCYTNDGPLCAG